MPDFGAWTSTDWSALAAMATTVIALTAAIVAVISVRQARRLREEQAQPFVVVDFEPSPAWVGLMDLVIKNTGQTLAKDVRVNFDPPLKSAYYSSPGSADDYDIMKSRLVREGIPSMPPGKEFRILFERMPDLFNSDLPRQYTATATFSSLRRAEKPLVYLLDLDVYFGLRSVNIYGAHHAAKALREIESTVKRWTAHFNGIRTYGIDERAYNAELDEEYEERIAQLERIQVPSTGFEGTAIATDAPPIDEMPTDEEHTTNEDPRTERIQGS